MKTKGVLLLAGGLISLGIGISLFGPSVPGTDDQAMGLILEIQPDYQAWLSSLWEPTDIQERWLFALQTFCGLSLFLYCLWKLRCRASL